MTLCIKIFWKKLKFYHQPILKINEAAVVYGKLLMPFACYQGPAFTRISPRVLHFSDIRVVEFKVM